MLNLLQSVTGKIQLITSAEGLIHVIFSGADTDATATPTSDFDSQTTPLSIATATTTDIFATPAASKSRNAKLGIIRNAHASVVNTVTLVLNISATQYEILKVTLLPGESIWFVDGVPFRCDANMGVIGGLTHPRPLGITVADQTVGASATAYITGSAIDATSLVVGSRLRWYLKFTKTAAATASMTFSNLWGPNGTTADTARGPTLATGTQTAVADVAELDLSLVIRAVGATGNFHGGWEFQHDLTSTGFSAVAKSNTLTQGLSANFDMTVAALKAGLQLVTGTSHSIVIQQCITERNDP